MFLNKIKIDNFHRPDHSRRKLLDGNFCRLTIADESYSSNFHRLMVWSIEVIGPTFIGFEADGSYHFSGNFRRPGKADESYLTFIEADGS
jgi:hypothetical protein